MKILINTLSKDEPKREISVSKEEAGAISMALRSGIEFITIGTEEINAKYIVGIFNDNGDYLGKFPRLTEPRTNKTKIGEILDEMRSNLVKKGIIRK